MFALKNNKNIPTPFLRVVDHKVAEVNNGFVKLSGFSKNELLGKSIKEIKKILRIDSQAIEMEGIENISIFTKKYKSVYIFTKKYDPIEVKITLMDLKENGKIYYFTTTESTMLEEFIPYASSIISTNLIGCAVYTIDGLMLKANNSYFDFLGISQDKIGDCIGKNITDIVKINNLSGIEDIFIKIRNTLSSYCSNEFKCDYLNGKSKYFVVTYNLIYIKGKTKMIVSESFDVTEKVESRIELQNQKKKLNAIIDNISDSIVVFGKDSNELLLNYNAKKEFCNPSSKEELLEILNGMTCFDIDGKLIKFQKYIIDKVLGGEVLKDALVSFPMTGGCKYIRISGTPMYDTFGEIYMVALRFRDATDYVKRDSLIEKQRDQLEAIVENISDNIVIIDKNGTYIMFNKAAENNPLYNFDYLINIKDRYLQVEHYDMNGKLLDFEDIPSSRVLRGEKFIDNKVKVKNEKCQACYDVSGIPLFDECGRFNMGIMVLHDITDKLKNQENIYIKTQYEAINKIIYNLEMGFTRISFPDFKIIDINNKSYNFLRKFGRNVGSFDSILGDCIFDFYNDNVINENMFTDEEIFNNYIIFKYMDNDEEKYLKLVYRPLYGLNKKIVEIIIIAIDITELVREKNDLQNVLESQDELFINVSHELKTPLNIIYSASQLLEMYLSRGFVENRRDKIDKSIDSIKQNCCRLTRLINNILDISKIKSGYYKLYMKNDDIISFIGGIVDSVQGFVNEKGLDIEFRTEIDEKTIAFDHDKIEKVMLNIISNAIKFTDIGGKIVVSASGEAEYVKVRVKDNGIGLDSTELENIFNRFGKVDKTLSRNTEGSGIGLSLVKSIVELHGGKIWAESKPGEGCEFMFVIPAMLTENYPVLESGILKIERSEMINIEFSDIYDKV